MTIPGDEYTYSVIERAVVELIKVYGFTHLEEAALNQICLVVYRVMSKMGSDVKSLIDHAGKSQPDLNDMIFAAKKRRITVEGLHQLMIWTDPTPPPVNIPIYPVKLPEPPVRPFSPAELAEREEKEIPSFCPSIRIKPPPSKVSRKEKQQSAVKTDGDPPPVTAAKRIIQPLTRTTVDTVRLAKVIYKELTVVQQEKAGKPPSDNPTFAETLYDFHARLQENPVEDRVEEENPDATVTEIIYPPQLCAQPPIFHRRPQLMHTNAPSRVEVTDDPERDARLIQEHKEEREILDEMEIKRAYPRCVHPTHHHTRPPHSYPKEVFENCPPTPPAERERRERAAGLLAAASSRKYTPKGRAPKTPKKEVPKSPPKPRGRPRKNPLPPPPVVNEPPPRKPITIKLSHNYDLPPPAQDESASAPGPSHTPATSEDLMEGSSRMFFPQQAGASGPSRTQYNEFDVDPREGASSLLYRQFEERRAPSRNQAVEVDSAEQSERAREKKEKKKKSKKEKHRSEEDTAASDAVDAEKRHKHKKEKKEKKDKKEKEHHREREETAEEREERRRLKKERKRQEKAERKRERAPSSNSEAPAPKRQKEKEVSPRPQLKLRIHIGKPPAAPANAPEPVPSSSSSQAPPVSQPAPSSRPPPPPMPSRPAAPPAPSSRPIPPSVARQLPPPPPPPQPAPVSHGIFAEAMKPRPAPAKVPTPTKAPAPSKTPSTPKVKKEKDSHSSHRSHSRHTSEKIISERVQMSKALKESLNSIEKKEKKEPETPIIKKKKSHKKKEHGSSSKVVPHFEAPKPVPVVPEVRGSGEWPCPICSIPYTDLGESMVGCDTCGNWYHYSCVGLTHETVPRDDDPWFCVDCKRDY